MFDIVIRRGDTLPKIEKRFYVSGEQFDITGYTVNFIVMSLEGTELLNNDAEILEATTGLVAYQWTNDDSTAVTTDIAFARFEAVEGGNKFTVPNNRPLSIMLTSNTSHEYSYSGDPSARDIDRIRFLLQDTNMDKALFTDSEITYSMEEEGNAYAAAAELAARQGATFTHLANKTVGPLSIDYGSQGTRWFALERSLRMRGRRSSGAIAVTTQKSTTPHIQLGMHGIYHNPDPLKGDERDLTDYEV